MLVKVNDSYLGNFGLSNPTSHTVTLKRAGDPPFDVTDEVAAHHIKMGVLVPVEVKAAKIEKEPEPMKVEEPEEAAPVIEPAPIVTAPKKTTKRGGKRK